MWLKLSDDFCDHAKVEPLSDRAFRLHLHALQHCARNLTDGILTSRSRRSIMAKITATKRHVIELEQAGLWEAVGSDHFMHDFLEYNPAAATVRQERERAAARMRELRARKRSPERSAEQPGVFGRTFRRTFGDPDPSRKDHLSPSSVQDPARAPTVTTPHHAAPRDHDRRRDRHHEDDRDHHDPEPIATTVGGLLDDLRAGAAS